MKKESGLSQSEADKRLKLNGFNALDHEESISPLNVLINQFKSPLVYILLFAGILTFLLDEYTDSIVIFFTLSINTILGFYQEYKAEDALLHLKRLITPKALVIRDGVQNIINSDEIVVGDLVVISPDYQIPADGKLLEGKDISANEAILTGESVPVAKNIGDPLFMGTKLISGIGRMIINKTGSQTEVGKISQSVASISDHQTPLQEQLSNSARLISIIVLIVSLIVFGLGIVRGYDYEEVLFSSIAIAVAAVPEGLVITLTVILTVAMQRILKRKALVRKLIAAETLGSISVICTDKTGTLTEGNLQLVKSEITKEEYGKLIAVAANSMIDPLEIEMMKWAEKQIKKEEIETIQNDRYKIDGIPFKSEHKFTASLNKYGDVNIVLVYGAPEEVLSRSTLSEASKEVWLGRFAEFGNKGNRLLGLGYKIVPTTVKTIDVKDIVDLEWNGLFVYQDPVRNGVKEALEECKTAGIAVKVVTGDHLLTTIAIAKELGIIPEGDVDQSTVITGDKLEAMDVAELSNAVKKITIFARTSPTQKLKIVEALKANGEIVAMTGDGVNDAPALKKSDIGLVVNEASDVSKSTADIVLLDSDFATIVHAIEEGRATFDNIRKVVLYLTTGSFSEVILILSALLLGLPLPITAVQILWVNLVEDTFPALALAFEPKDPGNMSKKPRSRDTKIIDKQMLKLILAFILISDGSLLGLYYYLRSVIDDPDLLRTFIFIALGINSLFYIFSCRTLEKPMWQYKAKANIKLLLMVELSIILLIAAVYMPGLQVLLGTVALSAKYWFGLIGIGLFNLVAIEVTKLMVYKNKEVV